MKLLCISGSIRKESWNTKLAKNMVDIAAQKGVDAEFVDLKDYPMPIYHGDEEAANGLPGAAKQLKERFAAADAICIASPEYNGSFSALLKNTIDWISRPSTKDEVPLRAFQGKYALLVATSPGALGGLRGLVPLRMLLGNIGMVVLPKQVAIGKAYEQFEGDVLKPGYYRDELTSLAHQLVEYTL